MAMTSSPARITRRTGAEFAPARQSGEHRAASDEGEQPVAGPGCCSPLGNRVDHVHARHLQRKQQPLDAVRRRQRGDQQRQPEQSPSAQGANPILALQQGFEAEQRRQHEPEGEAGVEVGPREHDHRCQKRRRPVVGARAQEDDDKGHHERPGQHVRPGERERSQHTCEQHQHDDRMPQGEGATDP
jgi:hypothetical protein